MDTILQLDQNILLFIQEYIRCENARAYRHQDNQNIREGFGQDRFRRNERDEKQIRGLIRTGKHETHETALSAPCGADAVQSDGLRQGGR